MSFGDGLAAFNDSLTLIRRRGIRAFVWAPALVSLVVIGIGVALTLARIDAAVERLLAWLPSWLAFLDYLLTPLAYLVSALLGAWLFGYLATIVASPFLGFLAARVERELTGVDALAGQSWMGAALATVARELRKLAYHLPLVIAMLVVTLVPLINVAAPVLWVVFGAWMVAVQYSDYSGENHGEPFRATLAGLRAHRAASYGFGVPAFALLSIPLLNFIAVPIAVVGGTVLAVRLTRDETRGSE